MSLASAAEPLLPHAGAHAETTERAAERLWRSALGLLATAAHRVLPVGLLPYGPRGCRLAHRLRRGHGGFSRFFQGKRKRSVDAAAGVRISGSEARRPLVSLRRAMARGPQGRQSPAGHSRRDP